MQRTHVAPAVSLALLCSTALATEGVPVLQEILVEARRGSGEARPTSALDRALPADLGEGLRAIPGVSGVRMGGHGIDPVIRGQSETRLNVLLDGAYVHGGCPNRMDPPTAYSSIDSYDSVTVLKGFQSVRYGGGGSGGTVLLQRRTSPLAPEESFRGKAGAGFKTGADARSLALDLTAGGAAGFARGIAGYEEAGNYEDGRGQTVRSAYENRSGTLLLGWTPEPGTRLEGSAEAVRERDVLFPGAGMDSPASDADIYRLRFEHGGSVGWLSGFEAEIYGSGVDHLMDNYSLRTLTAPMKMRVPSTSDTAGGRASVESEFGAGATWTLGFDYQRNEREADRFAGPAAGGDPATLQSVLWPGVELSQTGLFAELSRPLDARRGILAGLRYDRVESTAGRADEVAMLIAGARTANDLYRLYYGRSAARHREDNLSGFLRYEQAWSTGTGSWYASAARSVRTADATERFLAANAGPVGGRFPDRWIGNPDLEPEAHHQLEVGTTWPGGTWTLAGSLFYDRVSDFILRDRAHGQAGILRNDDATVYRNVKARLRGAEAEFDAVLAPAWSARLGLSYVSARNTTDGRWIAQTPPLEGRLGLEYRQPGWTIETVLRFAASQSRVDDDPAAGSGQDPGEGKGWAVLDLAGQIRLGKQATLDLGVENLLDATYAYHVNRANMDPFNPEALRVNEPGRQFWVKLTATF